MDYKEKLKLAGDWYNDQSTTNKEKLLLETLFPELKESEDERIRKWCISHFSECINVIKDNDEYKEYLSNKVLAWLEKQDPKKFEDELEKAYKFANEVQYRKGYEDAKREIEKQCEQNPTDSYCEENCKGYKETGKCFADGKCKAKKESEQNSAWSEEDEKMVQCIHKYVKASASNFDYENIQIWFRNIKNRVQPHWKPTVDQMQSLYFAVITYGKKDDYKLTYDSLNSLYDDLKKL